MPSVHEWTGVLVWMDIISKMVLKHSAQTDRSFFVSKIYMCGHGLDGARPEDTMKLFSPAEGSST